MDMNVYLAEQIIRDRLTEARVRAERAALLRQPNEGSPRANGFGHRLLELGWLLVAGRGRKAAGARRPLEGGTLDDLHGEITVL